MTLKSLVAALLLCGAPLALAQTSEPAAGPATPMPPAPIRPANEPPRQPGLPTLWLVGDSTMHNGTRGEQGWGEPFIQMFDPAKVRVLNRGMGGRSSRTFVTEGRWDDILQSAEKGDFVLIQLGHNDGGPVSGDNRERGSLRGVGDETKEVELTLGANKGKHETVHTFGWYIAKMVNDAKAKGMTPIVCSWVPHGPRTDRPFTYDPTPKPDSYRLSAQQVAEKTGAHYIDLYQLIWTTYAGKTPAQIKKAYFTDFPAEMNNTHTNPDGARHNAECVVEGIKSLTDLPLAGFLKPAAATRP